MNRRHFVGGGAALAAALTLPAALPGCGIPAGAGKRAANANGSADDRLAGKTAPELLAQYRTYLFDDFLPFVERYVADREYGGFMCNTGPGGNRLSDEKYTWYQGRGLWTYSYLYNKIIPDPQYLEIAGKAARFVLSIRPADSPFWPANFSRDGRPIAPPAGDVYAALFCALGLQEYAKASGRSECREIAMDILRQCILAYDRPDYFPRAARALLPTLPLIPGARIAGHWFMFLNLATQMLEAGDDPALTALADRAIAAFLDHHYHPETRLFNEVINHDLSRPENDIAQLFNTGHSLETLWMIMAEAQRRRDEVLFDRAALYFKRNLEVAWDDLCGGVFTLLKNADRYEWLTRKANWVQAETVIGLLLMIEHRNDPWARHWLNKVLVYFTDKFPLKRFGFPGWIDYADRKVTFVEQEQTRVEIFHHPRHLMMAIQGLERMAGV